MGRIINYTVKEPSHVFEDIHDFLSHTNCNPVKYSAHDLQKQLRNVSDIPLFGKYVQGAVTLQLLGFQGTP